MFRYYLKLGTLSIRNNPVLSGLMVAAIAVGIGACMTMATIQYVMGGDPIPHRSDMLYHVQLDGWDPMNPRLAATLSGPTSCAMASSTLSAIASVRSTRVPVGARSRT